MLQRLGISKAKFLTSFRYIGENIESSIWILAGKTLNGVQSRNDQIATRLELADHGLGGVLRAGEGFDGRVLNKRIGAGLAIGDEPGNPYRQFFRHDTIAKAPTRHCIGFGKPVQDNRPFLHAGERTDTEKITGVNHAAVNLI